MHETTKAWMSLVQAICYGIKLGYSDNFDETKVEEFKEEETSVIEPEKGRRGGRSSSLGCRLLSVKRQGVGNIFWQVVNQLYLLISFIDFSGSNH